MHLRWLSEIAISGLPPPCYPVLAQALPLPMYTPGRGLHKVARPLCPLYTAERRRHEQFSVLHEVCRKSISGRDSGSLKRVEWRFLSNVFVGLCRTAVHAGKQRLWPCLESGAASAGSAGRFGRSSDSSWLNPSRLDRSESSMTVCAGEDRLPVQLESEM